MLCRRFFHEEAGLHSGLFHGQLGLYRRDFTTTVLTFFIGSNSTYYRVTVTALLYLYHDPGDTLTGFSRGSIVKDAIDLAKASMAARLDFRKHKSTISRAIGRRS